MSTEGYYWRVNACLNSNKDEAQSDSEPTDSENQNEAEACADDLLVYAVHKADPEFNSLGDGYFGLSPSRGIAGSEKMNLLE